MTFHARPWPILYKPADIVRGALLVVGPHPDDEIIAAGGLIAAHKAAGAPVVCAVVTDGALGDFTKEEGAEYVRMRRDESVAAGRALGGVEHRFLGFADGGLANLFAAEPEKLIGAFTELLRSFAWETVVFPSPYEVHPDHRATSLALIAAAQVAPPKRLLAYEIGEMLPINLVLDITAEREKKRAALSAFASQLKHNDLLAKVDGLNRARTVNCDDPRILACEAYLRIDPSRLDEYRTASEAVIRLTDAMAPAPYL